MAGKENKRCVSEEDLFDYFRAMLPEAREFVIEEHLADCRQCTDRARQMRLLNYLWDHWSPASHEANYLQAVVAVTLQKAQAGTGDPHWRERLSQWRENWAGQSNAALRVLSEQAGNVSQIITEGLEAITLSSSGWRLAPSTGSRVRGAVRTRGKAKPAPATVVVTPLQHPARIEVKAEPGSIDVSLFDLPPDQAAPLVLLIATQGDSDPIVKEPMKEEGAEGLIARYENVAPGEYLLVFEPTSQLNE